MQHFLKIVLVIVIALALSVALASTNALALEDALLDRLDKPTVSKVVDYLNDTQASRIIGFTLLLLMWTAIVFVIDRVVDQGFRDRGGQANRQPDC